MKMHGVFTRSVFLLVLLYTAIAEITDVDLNELLEQQNSVKINKCCEHNELIVGSVCRQAELYNQSVWVPEFKTEDGKNASVKYFSYVNGVPNCTTVQQRPIFDFRKSEDKLNLLSDGRLQHLIHHEHSSDHIKDDLLMTNTYSTYEAITIPKEKESASYIHNQDKYCLDKAIITSSHTTGLYALVCIPEVIIKNEN